MAVKRALLAALLIGIAWPAIAQRVPEPDEPAGTPPSLPDQAPGAFRPNAAAETSADSASDVWIFSGALQNSHESFSGTLIAGKGETQFELKLASGASCDGADFAGDVGLVRLKEITCSDDRVMKALFVPQGGRELKVFGHVGDERFAASAHLLGTEPVPDKTQTAAPSAPALEGRPGGATPPGPK